MIGMHFEMRAPPEIMRQRGMQDRGAVQKYVDSEVLRLCEPYTPKLSGILSGSGITKTQIGSGEVEWGTLYNRYQYYGKVMVGPAPKTVTSKDLVYHGGGKRGKMWFERMKIDHKDAILRGAAKLAGGKAK